MLDAFVIRLTYVPPFPVKRNYIRAHQDGKAWDSLRNIENEHVREQIEYAPLDEPDRLNLTSTAPFFRVAFYSIEMAALKKGRK